MGEDDARALAEQLLAATLPRRWKHVEAVAAEASRLCDELEVDRYAVVSAAWLHDIGYAPTVVNTGFHPLDGARHLRTHGWDDLICRLVAHHTDAAAQGDVQGLGVELRSEFPEVDGLERDVLWAADATTGPDGERLTLDERIREITSRYGEDHPVAQAMIASTDALRGAIARVGAAGG